MEVPHISIFREVIRNTERDSGSNMLPQSISFIRDEELM